MSFININWYIALAFCLIFFIGGRQLAEVPGASPKERRAVGLFLLAFAIPALLFPLAYLPGPIAVSPWYNTFRSVNRIELFSALVAPAAGYATYTNSGSGYGQFRLPAPVGIRVLKPLAFPLCVLLISLNFAGPLLRPLSKDAVFKESWTEGGVITKSIDPAGGPAALITAMYGLNRFTGSERDAVRGTYTDGAGTEFWYLARYAANRGYRTKFIKPGNIEELPTPSILPVAQSGSPDYSGPQGVGAPTIGAYVALLSNYEDGTLIIGDPAEGKLEMDVGEFIDRYGEPGLVLTLAPPKNKI